MHVLRLSNAVKPCPPYLIEQTRKALQAKFDAGGLADDGDWVALDVFEEHFADEAARQAIKERREKVGEFV